MSRRFFFMVFLLTLAVSFLVQPVFAGGWAVITLDELPGQIASGKPYAIGFMVRQHGRTPMEGLVPSVRAANPANGETLNVSAYPAGEVGHYQAALTFPTEGTWHWSIEAFTMRQPMPDLRVVSPDPAPIRPVTPPEAILIIGGLMGAGVAAWFGLRSRSRRVLGVAVIALLLVGAGFASASAWAGMSGTRAASQAQALPSAEIGQALFVAKGCVACHYNQQIEARYYDFSTGIGPDLTDFSASPEFLRQWLANPASIKLDTQMPDLNLTQDEIETLIAFLNAD